MRGRVGVGGGEAIEGGASGADKSNGGRREVLVLELLRHCAYDGAEVLVILLCGGGKSREERTAEIVRRRDSVAVLHFDSFHWRRGDYEWGMNTVLLSVLA